jgi:hypothetical protein
MARQDAAAAPEVDNQSAAKTRASHVGHDRRAGAACEAAVRLVMDPCEIASVVVQF